MIEITKRESKLIRKQFPQADIVGTKHRCYLAVRETDTIARYLDDLRGIPQPPTRRQRESMVDRYSTLFSTHKPRRP